MNIRLYQEEDLDELRRIHTQYSDDFDVSAMLHNTIGLFHVSDESKGTVCIGGVRAIAEAVLVTDKEKSVRLRREALCHILHASMFACRNTGFDQIHGFIQDDVWLRHLSRVGFKPTVGKSVVLCL